MRTFTTSLEWKKFYQWNANNQLPIPWELGAQLSVSETCAIVKSLQAWQLGETSEGVRVKIAARRYAAAVADEDFVAAIELFIGEEQRHGELLGQFLDLQGTGRVKRNWGDTVFRRLRGIRANMEVWTTVIIVVETLALIYYRAVMQATQSRVLQTICRQILRDEAHHLRFQYEHLAQMMTQRGKIARWLTVTLQGVLFIGTALAVSIGHHRALRAGGYPLRRFWRTAWKRMNFHWKMMQPAVWQPASHGEITLVFNDQPV